MKILGIETSCDDTCVSLYDSKLKKNIFNFILNQNKTHSYYGGIVPNLASIRHTVNIKKIFKKISNINLKKISLISYTYGPGLLNSLILGSTIAKTLAYSLKIPAIPINHIEAHLLSPTIISNKIKFPFIGLIISGGHTELIKANKFGEYKILGKTLDNSVGNILDKIGRLLGLGFPGGRKISKFSKYGILNKYIFPRPLINSKDLNFSFSGLETYILNLYNKNKQEFINNKCDVALELENTIIEILVKKSLLSLKNNNINTILISGGVSNNINIRKKFKKLEHMYKINVLFPTKNMCTDNATMIAYLGYLKFITNKKKMYTKFIKNYNLNINPKLNIETSEDILYNNKL